MVVVETQQADGSCAQIAIGILLEVIEEAKGVKASN